MMSIKQKTETNQLTITKADKGHTKIIINNKDNKFTKLTHDITNTLQKKRVSSCLNNSKHIINKDEKWKLINLNPRIPTIHATVNKTGNLIRPIINWKNAPYTNWQRHLIIYYTIN
jgi:hypothetical protein